MKKNISKWTGIVVLLVMVVVAVILVSKSNEKSNSKTNALGDFYQENSDKPQKTGFVDGLTNPETVTVFEPDISTGGGIVEIAMYSIDINNDGVPDTITRTRENIPPVNVKYTYKIELNSGEQRVNVTPDGFQTVLGANCAVKKLMFSFEPDFSVTVIERPLGKTWDTPTKTTETVYTLWGNRMHIATQKQDKIICDVADLFEER
ncbi:MAG: hypothetical protein K5912_01685 [Alphaproteobacteria bacterium]|nr:hypothetical protein [Alphaproteobacteria bacterium]